MEVRRRSRGTRLPTSSWPSAMGRVSSKTASLVKLRMAKVSSQWMGQGLGGVVSERYSIVTLRANMAALLRG